MNRTRTPWWLGWVGSLAILASSHAQTGVTINFNNIVGPASARTLLAPIYGPDLDDPFRAHYGNSAAGVPAGTEIYSGGYLQGTNYTAELWAGPEGTGESQLTPLARTTFRTSATGALPAGLFVPIPPVVVPFAKVGQRIPLQVRVWNNRGGLIQTYAEAECTLFQRGKSVLFLSLPLGGATGTETIDLIGLQSFNIVSSPALFFFLDTFLDSPSSPTPVYNSHNYFFMGEDAIIAPKCLPAAAAVQWSHEGTNILTGTNQTLTLRNLSLENAGVYTAVCEQLNATTYTRLYLLPNPRLSEPRLENSGKFVATVEGVTNRIMVLECSPDLAVWTFCKTQFISHTMPLTNDGPLATSQFFRVRPRD